MGATRKPLLSDDGVEAIRRQVRKDYKSDWQNGYYVRDWYESKITSGELRLYKNLGTRLTDKGTLCNACERWINVAYDQYCPGCGEKL